MATKPHIVISDQDKEITKQYQKQLHMNQPSFYHELLKNYQDKKPNYEYQLREKIKEIEDIITHSYQNGYSNGDIHNFFQCLQTDLTKLLKDRKSVDEITTQYWG